MWWFCFCGKIAWDIAKIAVRSFKRIFNLMNGSAWQSLDIYQWFENPNEEKGA
jgi:hypothetical protein